MARASTKIRIVLNRCVYCNIQEVEFYVSSLILVLKHYEFLRQMTKTS